MHIYKYNLKCNVNNEKNVSQYEILAMYKEIIYKLNLENENKSLSFFFKFIENEKYCVFIIQIFPFINKYFHDIGENSLNVGGKLINLNIKNIIFLYSSFICKSLIPSSLIENEDDFTYISTDNFINNFIKYENNFWIYYYSKTLKETDKKKIKVALTKLYYNLINNNILFSKKEGKNNKTILFISNGIFLYEEVVNKLLNFSETPLISKFIENNIYLIGDSFYKTSQVLRPNLHSNKTIFFNELSYINKISKISVYVDEDDFKDILKIYENHYKIKIINIDEIIKKILIELKEIYYKLNILNKKITNSYNDMSNEIIKKHIGKEKDIKKIFLFFYLKLLDFENDEIHIKNKKYSKNEIIEKFNKWFIFKEAHDIGKFKKFLHKEYFVNNETVEKYPSEALILNKIKKLIYKNKDILENVNNLIKIDYSFKNELLKKLKNKQMQLSVYLQMYNIKLILDLNLLNKKIYFPFFFDFRSRKYFDSRISITNFKASRFFLNYGAYSAEELKNLDVKDDYYDQIIFNNKIIEKVIENLNLKAKKYIKRCIFWSLISIGKEFLNKEETEHDLNKILEKGYYFLNSNDKLNKIEDEMTLNYYKKIIFSLKEKNPKKRFIHKDATASFIQNLIRIVGPQNEESLIKANLMSNEKWYDIYSMTIDEWKKKLYIKENNIIINNEKIDTYYLKYFIRKTIKKTLMITSYDATFYTKWKDFIEVVDANFDNCLLNDKKLLILFKNYNSFILTFFDNFLSKKSDILIKIILTKININNNAKIWAHDAHTDIIYYKQKENKIYLTINVKDHLAIRKKKIIKELDKNEIDVRKIKQSVKANWVHFSDATLIRQINNLYEIPLLSIHDCVLVDMLNVSTFIKNANEAYKQVKDISIAKNLKYFNKVNSIFIFI